MYGLYAGMVDVVVMVVVVQQCATREEAMCEDFVRCDVAGWDNVQSARR